MKKIKFLLGLALAGLILGACSQTGTYENADLMNEQAASRSFNMTPYGSGGENLAVGPCATEYPEANEEFFTATVAGIGVIKISARNDGNNSIFTVIDKPNGNIRWISPGITSMGPSSGSNLNSLDQAVVPNPIGWKSGDKVSISFYFQQASTRYTTPILHYTLVGICQETTTTLTGAPDGDVCIGTPVTLTATVTGGTLTGGTLIIKKGDVTVETLNVLGPGPYKIDHLVSTSEVSPVDGFSFTAVYSGDGNFLSSTSTPATTVSVVDCSTSTSLSASDYKCAGDEVTLTATVSGGATFAGGSVQFTPGDLVQLVHNAGVWTATTTVDATLTAVSYTASFVASGIFTASTSTAVIVEGIDCSDDDDDEFENKFDVVTMCTNGGKDRTATFTFTAGSDGNYEIQGGLTAWSSVPVLTKSTGTVTSRRVGNQNHIITWSGALIAGQTVTVTVTWTNSRNITPIIDEWYVSSVEGSVKTKLLTSEKLGCNAMWSSDDMN